MVTDGAPDPAGTDPPGSTVRLPWLLRRVNQRYRAAIRDRLAERGVGDLPQPGFWAVMVLAHGGTEATELAFEMGVSKQAVSKLVNTLVAAGFVDRRTNDTDRRRTDLLLTAKGLEAAGIIDAAVRETEADLEAEIGDARFAVLVRGLQLLARKPDR